MGLFKKADQTDHLEEATIARMNAYGWHFIINDGLRCGPSVSLEIYTGIQCSCLYFRSQQWCAGKQHHWGCCLRHRSCLTFWNRSEVGSQIYFYGKGVARWSGVGSGNRFPWNLGLPHFKMGAAKQYLQILTERWIVTMLMRRVSPLVATLWRRIGTVTVTMMHCPL